MTRIVRISLLLVASLLLVSAGFAGTATAKKKKKGFKTGTYKATGDGFRFALTVYKGTCVNTSWKKKRGYCLAARGSAPFLHISCTADDGRIFENATNGFIPDDRYIPSSGKYRNKQKFTVREDEYETHSFNLNLGRNGSGSGTIRLIWIYESGDGTTTCDSGKQKFKLKQSEKKTKKKK